jgi:peptidoglycan/LPS O-acetylase OafA/YrhL
MYYEKAELSKKFMGTFFIKRIARVFPLYFLLTTLFFVVYYINGDREHWLGFYLLNITYLKGFSSWFMFTGIYPAWSLTVEETFYVLAPFIFLLIKKRNIFFGQVLRYSSFGWQAEYCCLFSLIFHLKVLSKISTLFPGLLFLAAVLNFLQEYGWRYE